MILDSGTVLPLRHGWRAWVYRGRRRLRRRSRLGHLSVGFALYTATYLR